MANILPNLQSKAVLQCYDSLNVVANGRLMLSDEKRLLKHLLDNYEKVGIDGRPVYNASETVIVKFGIALVKLLEMNVEEETGTFIMWQRNVSISHANNLKLVPYIFML